MKRQNKKQQIILTADKDSVKKEKVEKEVPVVKRETKEIDIERNEKTFPGSKREKRKNKRKNLQFKK